MRFAGYAAIFDTPDHGGDIVRKGAFARAARAGLPLLWQHDRSRRIGFVERLEEDERGLRVIAQMDANAPPVVDGAGLSFGYKVRKARNTEKDNRTYRELTDVDLIEVSVVTHPMQPQARVLAVENQECRLSQPSPVGEVGRLGSPERVEGLPSRTGRGVVPSQ